MDGYVRPGGMAGSAATALMFDMAHSSLFWSVHQIHDLSQITLY
jgi:hypothetical protein